MCTIHVLHIHELVEWILHGSNSTKFLYAAGEDEEGKIVTFEIKNLGNFVVLYWSFNMVVNGKLQNVLYPQNGWL